MTIRRDAFVELLWLAEKGNYRAKLAVNSYYARNRRPHVRIIYPGRGEVQYFELPKK